MPDRETVMLQPELVATLMSVHYVGRADLRKEHLKVLHRLGLLDVGANYQSATVTELGAAHIRQLCALPLPEEQVVFLNADGDKV